MHFEVLLMINSLKTQIQLFIFMKSFTVLFCLILSLSVFSQSNNDSIQRVKSAGGYQYEQFGHTLTLENMTDVMKSNPLATKYIKSAKGSIGIATVLGYGGGFLIGYPIGTAIAGGKANWTMAIIGCGLVIITIPIVSSANKNIKMAVDTFNKDKKVTSNIHSDYDLKLGFTQNGLGLIVRF